MSRSILKAAQNCWQNISLIATDMDGTLTKEGKFTSDLLEILEEIAKTEIDIIIVTGRSAGWVDAVANYLPIQGAIAENGGLFYNNQSLTSKLIREIEDIDLHRQQLAQIFSLVQERFPHIKESRDNRFRLTDWTFDVAGLTTTELEEISNICWQEGWSLTYSTIQCHIKHAVQNKAIALQQVLSQHFPQLQPEQIVTVGDSPNDQSLFDASKFPLSVGVANVLHYKEQLQHQPTYITSKPEVEGFRELVELLITRT